MRWGGFGNYAGGVANEAATRAIANTTKAQNSPQNALREGQRTAARDIGANEAYARDPNGWANAQAAGAYGQGQLQGTGATLGGDSGAAAGAGMNVGGNQTTSNVAAANVAQAAARTLGKSLQDFHQAREGSNISVAMSSEDMNRLLDSPEGQSYFAGMNPKLEGALRDGGGSLRNHGDRYWR